MTAHEALSLVEAGPCHSLPVGALQAHHAAQALDLGWLRCLPARGRWTARYVVTVKGSYRLGTFDYATM